MIKAVLSAALLVAFCSVAQAAPPAPGAQMTNSAATHGHWLSDGLNKLVFWRPPAEAGGTDRTAH